MVHDDTDATRQPRSLRHLDDDGAVCIDELRSSGFNEFDEEVTNVTIYEASDTITTLQKTEYTDNASLIGHLDGTLAPKLRIISIPQYDSYEPLEIGFLAMESILRTQNVSPDFLSTLYAAGWPPRESEEGFGHAIENREQDGSFNVTYLARYYEKREASWHLRQTGVYHAYSRSSQSHVFIILQPREDSALQAGLDAWVGSVEKTKLLLQRPLVVHEMLFQSYIGNWRSFLKDKGADFQRSAEKLFALDYRGDSYLHISFEKLQWWRDLEDRIMPCHSVLESTLNVLECLDGLDVDSAFFASRKSTVKALMTSASGLQKRIHGALSLLRDTLELKNQSELEKVNRGLLRLQRENVDDNETVKVITVLTLIYLPGSFVASLFGTNLFVFNTSTSRMKIANNFWWYMVLFVPLMIVTIATWLYKTRTSRAKRAKRAASLEMLDQVAADGSIHLQNMKNIVHRQIEAQA